MKIIYPHSDEYVKSEGPGGYKREKKIIDISKFVEKLSFYHITIPKGKKSDGHYHPKSHELFYSLTPLKVRLNGTFYDLPSDTLIVTDPGDSHEFEAGETEIHYLAFMVPMNSDDKVMVS